MKTIKDFLLANADFRRLWTYYSAHRLHRRYRSFEDTFGRIAREHGFVYSEDTTIGESKKRVSRLNIHPKQRGNVHTGIVVLTDNWGIAYVQELKELGQVSVFDWRKEGFDGADHEKRIGELNELIISYFRRVHKQRPLDWIFLPVSGMVILKETIQRMRDEFMVPVVNNWLDCKQNFVSSQMSCGQNRGQIDIAPAFDLVCTSSRSTCEWYMAIGANPLFLPEGFSPHLTPRVKCSKKYDIGFLGAKYGPRVDYVNFLKKNSLSVEARGYGWEKGNIPLEGMGHFFSQCKVNLGMGGIGYSTDLLSLKARDFEVPGAGGVYLTSYNSDLADFFEIGKDIICYHSVDEMAFLAKRLLNDEEWRLDVAERAYARSMAEHRWLHRFEKILSILGIFENG